MIETTTAAARGRNILRSAMTRVMNARESEAHFYLMRRFPGLERDPFARGRERRESLFEVVAPSRG